MFKLSRDKIARLVAPLVGGVLALLLLAYVISQLAGVFKARPLPTARVAPVRLPSQTFAPAPGNEHGFRLKGAAEVRTALLRPYYEHIREHVPPYSKEDGHMQRRELDWSAPPPDPVELVLSKLSQAEPDQALAKWVRAC